MTSCDGIERLVGLALLLLYDGVRDLSVDPETGLRGQSELVHSDTHTSTCTTSYADVPVATDDDVISVVTYDDDDAADYVDDVVGDDDAAIMMMLLLIMMMMMKNSLFAERECCCFDSFMKTFSH